VIVTVTVVRATATAIETRVADTMTEDPSTCGTPNHSHPRLHRGADLGETPAGATMAAGTTTTITIRSSRRRRRHHRHRHIATHVTVGATCW
jgi:hypothetical protein